MTTDDNHRSISGEKPHVLSSGDVVIVHDSTAGPQPAASFYRGFFLGEQQHPLRQRDPSWGQMLFQGLVGALPIVGLYWLYLRSQRIPPQGAAAALSGKAGGASGGGAGGSFRDAMMKSMDPLGRRSYRYLGKEVNFASVIGIPEALADVKQYVDFLKDPRRFTRLGARLPRGCLLTGEPGTGKTLLAKAVAGEASVPFFTCSGADFIEVYAGSGPRRVREIFEEARANSPCVIFFDEIDAIGSRGGTNKPGGMSGEENRTINQLLAEMDGLTTDQAIVILAATNFPDNLDSAIVREGRFDRKLEIPMPDEAARRDLFEYYLKKVATGDPTGATAAAAANVSDDGSPNSRAPVTTENPTKPKASDPPPTTATTPTAVATPPTVAASPLPGVSNHAIATKLAALTPGVSPATVATIVNEAALAAAVARAPRVEETYLTASIDDVLVGKKQRSRMPQAMIERVALHEAGHALVAWMLPQQRAVVKVSVVPRGRAAGFTQQLPREMLDHTTDTLLFTDICVLLGGRTAESTQHRSLTTGAQDDLQRATLTALRQFLAFGMSRQLGLLAYDYQRLGEARMSQLISKQRQRLGEEEARRLVAAAADVTTGILKQHAEKLIALASELAEKKELNAEDLKRILGPRPATGSALEASAKTVLDSFIHGAESAAISEGSATAATSTASPRLMPAL